MKKNTLLMVIGIIFVALGAILLVSGRKDPHRRPTSKERSAATNTTPSRVPAHYQTAPAQASLAPTLPPEQFTGKTREAYRVVREIPQTIAQLPCYCYCDEGHGHKSLYSCFEDNHAAHCAVCVQEALLAHKLEKEQRLNASQIRERIVGAFGSSNH
ncbi:MAG TPA: CYCXC family (seleno)protein [Pyrinomonadaceae bacterium]|nr:CYCXC family (seleno)protein [Pyrinomonadaceae bacterium]